MLKSQIALVKMLTTYAVNGKIHVYRMTRRNTAATRVRRRGTSISPLAPGHMHPRARSRSTLNAIEGLFHMLIAVMDSCWVAFTCHKQLPAVTSKASLTNTPHSSICAIVTISPTRISSAEPFIFVDSHLRLDSRGALRLW